MHNRWFQLCASLVAMIMIANLQYSWTLFVKPMQAANGWPLDGIQWAFTLFVLFQTWIQPVDGWLIDRLGPRLFITIAGVLCGAGWSGLGYATTLPQVYALYIMAGIGAALVYSGSMGSALKWFGDRRGLASGIIAAGFGGGTALFIPFIVYVIGTYGYRTAFLWTGILQGLVIATVAQVLRHPPHTAAAPKALGAKPAATASRSRRNDEQFTTMEMLRTPHFYVLYVMFVMMSTGGLLVTAQAGPVAQSWGLSAAALAAATTLSPIANGAARVFWGMTSDRIGRETTMALTFVLQAACLAGVLVFGKLSGTLFTVMLVLTFFTWGQIYSLFPSTLGDYYGARHATSNYGFLYTAKGVASILGGGVAAMLYQQFGNWSACFYGSAAMALIAAGIAVVLKGLPLPSKAAAVATGSVAPAS